MAKKIGLGLLLGLTVWLAGRTVSRWYAGQSAHETHAEVTYICLETKAVVRGAAQPEPALNPHTGRRTLVRAVYSAASQAWVAAPPEEALRKHRQRFLATDRAAPPAAAPATRPGATR